MNRIDNWFAARNDVQNTWIDEALKVSGYTEPALRGPALFPQVLSVVFACMQLGIAAVGTALEYLIALLAFIVVTPVLWLCKRR